MSLEDLEKELYKQKTNKRQESELMTPEEKSAQSGPTINSPWKGGSVDESGGGILKKLSKYSGIIITALIILVVVLIGFAGFYLYQYFTTKDVAMNITGPSEVMVGAPFTVSVTFSNLSQRTLSAPKVTLSLPDGVILVKDPNQRVITQDVDSIKSGISVKEDFEVAVVGTALQTYQFSGRVSYSYEAATLSSRFEKASSFSVLARDPIISLDLTTPNKVLNGEDFEVHLRYQNITDQIIPGARIYFKLPDSFSLSNSNPKMDNFALSPADMASQTAGDVIFSGSIIGQESSFFNIEAHAQILIDNQPFDINVKTASIGIEASPLSLKISNGLNDSPVNPGDSVNYTVAFTNNSDINLSDAVLKVVLRGDMYDLASVSSDGYFNSTDHSMTWTAANLPDLKEIKSRSGGQANFKVQLKSQFPVYQLTDKNFTIKATGQISSPTVPYNVVASETVGMAVSENKVAGQLQLNQRAFYKEPNTDIVNSGPLPPSVGNKTDYTIHWNFIAWASDFSNVAVSAFLGPGVNWTGKFSANSQAVPAYNDRTQKITWNVGSITANQGIIGAGPQSIFQIELVPSLTQSGTKPVLISRITVTGDDPFTGKPININLDPINISNLSDFGLPDKFDTVQQ
jgi:hypothetical protein